MNGYSNITPREFMNLPLDERRRLMTKAVNSLAKHYANDAEWRELDGYHNPSFTRKDTMDETDKPIAPIQFNWKRRRRQLQDWLEATSITETLAQHEPYTMVKIHSYLKGRHYSVVAVSECSPKDEWDKGRGVEVANGHGYKKLARRLVAVERNLAKKGKITDYLYKAEDFTLGPVWN